MWADIRAIPSTPRHLRSFGLTVGIFLLLLSGVFAWIGKNFWPWTSGAGVFLIAAGIIWPRVLWPLQKVWMTLALCLGWVMTRVILSLVFYAVVTPIALLTRLAGKDFMDRRIEKQKSSYWHERVTAPTLEDLKKQF